MTHTLLGAVLALALAGSSQSPSSSPGTWILQIEGDAASLRVVGASHKPFAYKAPRGLTSDYRLSLLDQSGVVLATAPLDLSPFCMDRGHRGKAPHVHGDVVLEHAVATTVKVPARADAAKVRIEDVRDPKKPVTLGSIDRSALLALVTPAKRESERKEEKRGDEKNSGKEIR